jgi:hypothetical protein
LRAIVHAGKLEMFGDPAETLDAALERAHEISGNDPA